MTTTIKVTSHNYPARVQTLLGTGGAVTASRILTPDDGEVSFYCTTSQELRIVDLEYDDPAVLADKAEREAGARPPPSSP